MNINLTKTADGVFVPSTGIDYDTASKIKAGTEYNFSYKKIRNPRLHRKYFALINLLFENQDLFENKYAFRKWLEVKAGYYDAAITDSGVGYLSGSSILSIPRALTRCPIHTRIFCAFRFLIKPELIAVFKRNTRSPRLTEPISIGIAKSVLRFSNTQLTPG